MTAAARTLADLPPVIRALARLLDDPVEEPVPSIPDGEEENDG